MSPYRNLSSALSHYFKFFSNPIKTTFFPPSIIFFSRGGVEVARTLLIKNFHLMLNYTEEQAKILKRSRFIKELFKEFLKSFDLKENRCGFAVNVCGGYGRSHDGTAVPEIIVI